VKEYDYIALGSGSALPIVSAIHQSHPNARIAVIDKDDPGGICLNRGCIPSKLLLYPAELVRTLQRTGEFGIQNSVTKIDFPAVMERMRTIVKKDRDAILEELSKTPHLDYYHAVAEFVAPFTLKVGDTTIKSKRIFLCTGSKPSLPPIKNLDKVPYLTSDTILSLNTLPESVAIIGGDILPQNMGSFFLPWVPG
jgi:mycothione reductase